LARPFENYCELNISCRYDVELGNKITYSLCTAWKVVASKACDSANSGASIVRIKETMGSELEKRRSYLLAKNFLKKNHGISFAPVFLCFL
jgi:hypothetical protein